MTNNLRISTLAIATITAILATAACGSSDPPADDTSSTGGKTSASAAGGKSSTATTTEPSSSAGGASAAGGATSDGGTAATAEGGSTATTSTGTSADLYAQYKPACANTLAGTAVAKGITCTAADVQTCYKTCGIVSLGRKLETCTTDATTGLMTYQEETGAPCYYPPTDYSCYSVPAVGSFPSDATCGNLTAVIQSGTVCTAPKCTLCTFGQTGQYLDSSGNNKTGYCVCPAATINPDTGAENPRKWSCTSVKDWPCPSMGC